MALQFWGLLSSLRGRVTATGKSRLKAGMESHSDLQWASRRCGHASRGFPTWGDNVAEGPLCVCQRPFRMKVPQIRCDIENPKPDPYKCSGQPERASVAILAQARSCTTDGPLGLADGGTQIL